MFLRGSNLVKYLHEYLDIDRYESKFKPDNHIHIMTLKTLNELIIQIIHTYMFLSYISVNIEIKNMHA